MMISSSRIETKEELKQRLAKHDWGYYFSDDHSVWKKGELDMDEIKAAMKRLCTESEAERLYHEAMPKWLREIK